VRAPTEPSVLNFARELRAVGDQLAVLRVHPDYAAPEAFAAGMRRVLDDAQLE
jgi:hypothetical protein